MRDSGCKTCCCLSADRLLRRPPDFGAWLKGINSSASNKPGFSDWLQQECPNSVGTGAAQSTAAPTAAATALAAAHTRAASTTAVALTARAGAAVAAAATAALPTAISSATLAVLATDLSAAAPASATLLEAAMMSRRFQVQSPASS